MSPFFKFSFLFFSFKNLTLLRSLPTPWGHDFNKLEQKLTKDVYIQASAFLVKWFFRIFFKNANKIWMNLNYLPFKESVSLYFDKLSPSLLKNAFCKVWLKLAEWFWRKCEHLTTPTTDKGQIDQRSSPKPTIQVN